MELPAAVLIHNELLGLKGGKGDLIRVHDRGYYELAVQFGEKIHRVFLPIPSTVLIQRDPEEDVAPDLEIER